MISLCHHPDCVVVVPEKMWACRRHWPSLPVELRNLIWATYDAEEAVASPDYRKAAAACAEHWKQAS